MIVGLYWTEFAVYGLDGSLRYRMELGNGEELDVAGQYGYVCHGSALSRVIELATGAILRDNRMHTAQTPVCVTLLVQ